MGVVEGIQEIYFAQHLASNDPKIRNRAIKKLGRWLQAKSSGSKGLTEEDMLKIWKGVFYCMWMSDKPLVQEALADKICELIRCFNNLSQALLFIDTYFQTITREWFGIDRFRLEKFMMLMRRFIHHSFLLMKRHHWKLSVIRPLMDIMKKTVLHPTNADVPSGLKFHTFDVFLDELCQAGGNQLNTKQICWFIRPFAEILVLSRDNTLCESVLKEVFHRLVYDAVDDDEDETDENEKLDGKFMVDFNILADRLVQLSSGDTIRELNRARIYKLIGQYRDAASGVFPLEPKIDSDSGTDIEDDVVEEAAKSLLPTGKRRRSRNFQKRRPRQQTR